MKASEVIAALHSSLPWQSAVVTVQGDSEALDLMWPILCPNGTVLWRRSAAVRIKDEDNRDELSQRRLGDYLTDANIARLAILSDHSLALPPLGRHSSQDVLIIDLSGRGGSDVETSEVATQIAAHLTLEWDDYRLDRALQSLTVSDGLARQGSDFETLRKILSAFHWAHRFVDICVGPLEPPEDWTSHSSIYAVHIEQRPDGEQHLLVDFASLHEIVGAPVTVIGAAEPDTSEGEFWEAAASATRSLAELALRIQYAAELDDILLRIRDGGRLMQHPYVQQVVSSHLTSDGFNGFSRLLAIISGLGLDGASIVDQLEELALSADRAWARPAIETIGRLRARQARPTILRLTSDTWPSISRAAACALSLIDTDPVDESATSITNTASSRDVWSDSLPTPPNIRIFGNRQVM